MLYVSVSTSHPSPPVCTFPADMAYKHELFPYILFHLVCWWICPYIIWKKIMRTHVYLSILVNKCPCTGSIWLYICSYGKLKNISKRWLKRQVGVRHSFNSVLVTGPRTVSWRKTASKHVDWRHRMSSCTIPTLLYNIENYTTEFLWVENLGTHQWRTFL